MTTTRLTSTSSDARNRTASIASGTIAPLAATVTRGASAGIDRSSSRPTSIR